jgi:hypothetical protein
MIFRVGESKYGVPAGVYLARFKGVQALKPGKFGPRIAWEFEVAEGPYQGRDTSCLTDPIPTLRNACGRVIRGLTGKDIASGTEFDDEPFRGSLYQVRVADKESGRTRVVDVMPVHQAVVAGEANAARKRYVSTRTGQEPQPMSIEEVQALIDGGMNPRNIWIHDSESGWLRASDFSCFQARKPLPQAGGMEAPASNFRANGKAEPAAVPAGYSEDEIPF